METQTLKPKQRKEINTFITDSRTPGPAVRRAQAVLLLDQATAVAAIRQVTGYGKEHIFRLRRNYDRLGLEAFRDKRKGDPKPLLTKKQRQHVITLLTAKKPGAAGYVGAGWTTNMLGDYIERHYNVRYKSRTSYYLLFKDAKFTYHKPEKRYEKHDEAAVRKWRQQAKRRLHKAYREPNTEVMTGDEMVLSTQTTVQKVWLPAGEYPRIDVAAKRENRSVYGFLNLKTGQEHAWKTRRQNMYETVKVLKNLRKQYPKKQLLLLWDSARWHLGSKVTEWIERDGNVVTLRYPAYSPEENPQEHVWKAGRAAVTHNQFIADIDKATNEFVRYLRKTNFPYRLPVLGGIS
jgi:transposase